MKKHLANLITITRIIGTLCLIPFDVYSNTFIIIYLYCGLSDVLDGFVARKLNIISQTGSKLDSLSDLLYYSVMMSKVWSYLELYLPKYIWILIYLILFFRLMSYLFVLIRDKQLSSRHTKLNKLTGFLMFLLPLVVGSPYLIHYSYLVLAIAYISEYDEIMYIIKNENSNNRFWK